jgi:hypothetical protein
VAFPECDGVEPELFRVGWIRLGTESTNEPPHVTRSVHEKQHTEERLVEWAQSQKIDLKLAPDSVSKDRRVKGLYTERHPCTTETADVERKKRSPGNCHAYLTEKLHAKLPVFYSVPDDAPARHTEMLVREKHKLLARKPEMQRVYDAATSKFGIHPSSRKEIYGLRDAALTKIKAIPLPDREPDFQGYPAAYRVNVKAEADAGVAEIEAWMPPTLVVVPDQRSGPFDPPDQGGDGQSGKRPATSATSDENKRPRLAPAVNNEAPAVNI